MARKFLTAIDLTKNELQNAAVQNLASAPSSPVKGQLYFNSTGGDNTLYWWDGTTWVAAKSSGTIAFGNATAATTFALAKVDGVAVTASRSDHHHGTPAHSAAEHSTIPLSALAAAGAAISMGGFVINNVGTPVAGTDAANKNYVDNSIAGLAWKDSVRVASTAQVALTGLTAIDGVTPIATDRVLLKAQTAPAENGIWVAAAGAWTRATDADAAAELLSAAVYVEEGTTQGDTAWVMTTNAPITVGTTALTWAQFAGGGNVTAGAGMTQSGNTLNVIAGDATLTVAADSIVRAALTGDVTTSVNAATIAANAVTNTKLADMASGTVKGRVTAATGDPEDLTPIQLSVLLSNIMPRKVWALNSGGLTTTVIHSFGAIQCAVEVFRNSAPFDTVECDVERPTVNEVLVRFATSQTAGDYQILVVG